MGLKNSSPCQNCLNLMKKLNIRKIIYSENDGIVTQRVKNYQSYGFSSATRYVNNM